MAKHVFEISAYGYCHWRGEYVGETEKSYRVERHGVKSIANKFGLVCVESDNPLSAAEAYTAAVKTAKQAALAVLKGGAS